MLDLILEQTRKLLVEKGVDTEKVSLTPDAAFLGTDLPMDSLDLATLLVILEELTGLDPFRSGFRNFTTPAELATLYDECAAGGS